MSSKRQKRPVEAIAGLYSTIPHAVLDSTAFKGSGHPAKALLLELMRQHTGKNNGHLQLSTCWLIKERGWKSRGVIQRARDELINRKLVILTRQGGINAGASQYAVTWLAITNFVNLDIHKKDYHQGAWSLMDKLQVVKTQKPYPQKVQSIPLEGTAQYPQKVQ